MLAGGETDKRLATIENIAERLMRLGADRSTTLISYGGGVIGDLVGFTAAVFMRGVPYYHVPTTLLAMVDASLGGKNGVDLPSGKNLLGTVYQPQAVLIDPRFLLTLPADQFSFGMAEVIKHAIFDKTLFSWLEHNLTKIQQRHLPTLERLISKNIKIKTAVVQADVKEQSVRALLNLGHTFGHAFERLSGYTFPHGAAVAVGLVYASAYTNMPQRQRLLQLLRQFNLPTQLPPTLHQTATPARLVVAMQADKKRRGKNIMLVLPVAIGTVRINQPVSSSKLLRFIKRYQAMES